MEGHPFEQSRILEVHVSPLAPGCWDGWHHFFSLPRCSPAWREVPERSKSHRLPGSNQEKAKTNASLNVPKRLAKLYTVNFFQSHVSESWRCSNEPPKVMPTDQPTKHTGIQPPVLSFLIPKKHISLEDCSKASLWPMKSSDIGTFKGHQRFIQLPWAPGLHHWVHQWLVLGAMEIWQNLI